MEKSPEIGFWEKVGEKTRFWEKVGEKLGKTWETEVKQMRKKNYKGRCEKRSISKCTDICRTYDAVQAAYADMLARDDDIAEFRCNVLMKGLSEGDYTSDFVCTKADGSLMVRECTYRKMLTRPTFAKLLEASRQYWLHHGVSDWGIVTNEEK